MKLGLALPHYDISFPDQRPASFDRVARYAGLAEASGFHQLWVSDHFWLDLERYGGPAGRQGTPECWTMLSALAVLTSRARLGTLVLATGFRPPTLLAKMAATLDQLAGGRLDLGLGAGWNEAEFTENGLPFPRPGERLAMLEEALGVLRALLTDGAPASFSGRWYHADQAPVVPGPVQKPRPPLWVGGKGDRLLGVVARAADGWNTCWAMTAEDYQERTGVLTAACQRAGRDPGEVRRSLGLNTLIGRDPDDLVERWGRLVARTPGGILDGVELRDWAASRLVGTPDEVVAQLRGWEERGVEQVISSFGALPFSVFEDEQLELAAELVLPRLEGRIPYRQKPVPRPASRLPPHSQAPPGGNLGSSEADRGQGEAVPGLVGGVQVGVGGLQLGPQPARGGVEDLVGEPPGEGVDAALDRGQGLGVGLLLLPDDRLQRLGRAAERDQGGDLGGVVVGPDPPGPAAELGGQLVEAVEGLHPRALAAPVAAAPADQDRAAGDQHPPRLGQGQLPVRDQVEHVDLEHGVDAGVAEREPGRVGPQQRRGRQALRGRLGPVALQHRQGQVDPDHLAAAAVQGQGHPPGADPHLQQAGGRPDGRLIPVGGLLLDLPWDPPALVVVAGGLVEGDAHTTAWATTRAPAASAGGRGRRATRCSIRPRRRVTARRRSHRSTATPSGVARTSTQFTG
jgi:probable F420-dependent oxidoreductase